ncbi:MAG: hypothetical protein NTY02_14955 [Acidobacteria bacterium]|nr:hypothetical protein [Acidobacteriota bacterium]
MAGVTIAGPTVNLPRQAGPWIRPDEPRRITEQTIFDYMDGAGELYLAYRFEHLDIYEYAAADRSLGRITVELYWMKGSDDAFGLLSTDWGGEAIDVGGQAGGHEPAAAGVRSRPDQGSFPAVPPHQALYGGGLLRFWSDDLYGRVMASRESPQSRTQVLAIARAIVGGRPRNDHPPEILSRAPIRSDGGVALRPERTCFFRSHLVLNSVYYLAPGDILGLGPAVDALTGEYRPTRPGERPARLVQIVYPSPDATAAALRSFLVSYLPAPARPAAAGSGSGAAKVEGGWVGWAARARGLAIVFDAPSAGAAKELATTALMTLIQE